MNECDNGGPAFPRDHAHDGHNGMTLRDYFAAKAMASMVAAMSTTPKFAEVCSQQAADCELSIEDYVAARTYDWADAMLKAKQS